MFSLLFSTTLESKANTESCFLSSLKLGNIGGVSELDIPLSHFITSGSAFYQYDGSLTVPGCNEDVTWLVMNKIEHMSKAQLS